ncbi:MAG: hypothetical protein ACYCWW_00630 [Deltaproteobacteria bacterium]
MRALTNRRAVIEWAGAHHAYPLQKQGDPSDVKLGREGEDEQGYLRVGWKQLFTPLDRQQRLVVVDDTADFSVRILPATQAHRELPKEAFGAPWWQRLLHELWLDRPAPAKGG